MKITSITDKVGSFGAIIAAMGCASCFPLLGSLAASLGLGFLAQFEGVFINTLLPVFALIALVSVIIAWYSHRHHWRALLGAAGPVMVLLTLYPLWTYNWSTYMFYFALVLMLVVSIWDVLSPPHKERKLFS